MMARGIRLAVVASLVLALPVTAQRAGTMEVGAFARYVDFDNTLGLGNAVGVGARPAVAAAGRRSGRHAPHGGEFALHLLQRQLGNPARSGRGPQLMPAM